MGWSHRAEAGRTFDTIEDACYSQTGLSNKWRTDTDREYFLEVSQRDQPDGSICGKVYRLGADYCIKCGTFKIAGNGQIVRLPESLRTLANV